MGYLVTGVIFLWAGITFYMVRLHLEQKKVSNQLTDLQKKIKS